MVRLATHFQQSITEPVTAETQWPPTNLYSNEPPLETDFHRDQIALLIRLLKYWWQDRSNFYVSGNLTVYYNEQQLKSQDYRGPDVFVVLDAEQKGRRSWAIWEEDGKYPNVVIELLSDSTAALDKGKKKQLYQDIWQVPDYFLFHPETLEFLGFHLVDGQYEALVPNEQGRLWSEQLGLFLGVEEQELRWFTAGGQLIPLPEVYERKAKEQALQAKEQERKAKEQERKAKEQERKAKEQALHEKEQERQAKAQALQRVAELEELLRSQGINPNQRPESSG